ncbi:DUF3139 domain-containing protein [Aquibacillus sediminis]|uniref:DUF3139 domain-containing protein n=1 Tax=Aquibacillus sediminis TaxID=2574734 RepID=UPI001108C2CD|nr:DUF3139 domain-containing protein [Aquibacillus sediminis]
MKKRTIVYILTIIALLFVGLSQIYIKKQQDQALIDDTLSYLTEKGYEVNSEIADISVVDVGGEARDVPATVVTFTDEPSVTYFYSYKQDSNQVMQVDVVNEEGNQTPKHQEF